VAVLRRGGLVVYPTETAYALGCDATNAKARRRLCKVKNRERAKQLPLIMSSLAAARRVVRFNAEALRLARKYWPGPLTLRLPEKGKISHTIALRVSSHPVARALAARLGRPIVSTSANMSGEPVKYDIVSVFHDLGFKPDFVLDAGTLLPTPPSTIVGFDQGQPRVLRSGPIQL
jgi:L-threonylcarbamoyladenylate synthase